MSSVKVRASLLRWLAGEVNTPFTENMRRMFYKWLSAARKVRNRRAILQERECEMQRIQLEAAWDRWRGRFQAEKLLPLVSDTLCGAG
jgi:hypothetical protein